MAHIVFDCLVENQLIVSALLLCFIILERFFLKFLTANFVYNLASIIPLALVLANLPSTMKPFQSDYVGYYLVKPNINFVNDIGFTWLNLYLLVVGILLLTIFALHHRYLNNLQLIPMEFEQRKEILINSPIYISSSVNTPMVVGIFTSKLILPVDYKQQFTLNEVSLIVEHESIHMRRKDNLANVVFLIGTIFVWFNPLAWLAYASFRRLQELSCDQKVLKNKTREQQVLYSKALIACAANAPTRLMTYSHYGDKKMMLQRLTSIKRNNRSSNFARTSILVAAGIMLSSLVIAKPPLPPEPMLAKTSVDKSLHPIVRVAPAYPVAAAKEGITGAVTLKYDIAEDGTPQNISVVNAEPEGIFNREAKKALAKWRYEPSVQGYEDVLIKLEFALE